MQQVRTWYGIFYIEEGSIVSCDLYPKEINTLVKRLIETPSVMETNEVCGVDICTRAKEWEFVGSDVEYNDLFREVNMEYTMLQVIAARSDEHLLVQCISSMDELDRITNALSEMLKELSELNFPELGLVGEPLVSFMSRYGIRGSHEMWEIEDEKIKYDARNSTGVDLPGTCADNIKDMAANVSGLYDNRERLSRHVETFMEGIFPNLSDIAGANIGARLIGIAGNSEKLASMPSSTIQVLGAHNALFKHLKGNAPSPKHGVIFQHPLIRESPWWLRGKIARALASSISIAVRIDHYSGDYRPEVAEELNRKVEGLRKQYPQPPKRKNK